MMHARNVLEHDRMVLVSQSIAEGVAYVHTVPCNGLVKMNWM